MPDYRRAYAPGGTFFITLVTFERVPLFSDATTVQTLRDVISIVKKERPLEIPAGVILPDHSHFFLTLPDGDNDFSSRIGRIKALFTKSIGSPDVSVPASRRAHRESTVWQRRFWEHTVRDEDDFHRLLDYIHFNPVKHGLATCPHAWEYSSFRTWVEKSAYDPTWCCCCEGRKCTTPKFDQLKEIVGE